MNANAFHLLEMTRDLPSDGLHLPPIAHRVGRLWDLWGGRRDRRSIPAAPAPARHGGRGVPEWFGEQLGALNTH